MGVSFSAGAYRSWQLAAQADRLQAKRNRSGGKKADWKADSRSCGPDINLEEVL